MSVAFPDKLTERIGQSGLVAVIVLEHAAQAAPLAEALHAGGICAVELALRTPASLAALHALRKSAPTMLIGAGTVLTPEQVAQVTDAGADFAVAPGTNRRVLAAAHAARLPFGAGITTPSEIETALEYGCNVLKFFPAQPAGGLEYLRTMIAPYLHLGLRYIPLGGLNGENIGSYAADKNILALGGSWIAPKASIDAADWQGITRRAELALGSIRQHRQ